MRCILYRVVDGEGGWDSVSHVICNEIGRVCDTTVILCSFSSGLTI